MSYVAKIIIDHTKVPSNLTDFPVYVNLAHLPSSFWSVVANGGGDIRVFKSDDTTELPREVVACVNGGTNTGELYFKYTGTLSSTVDTEVHIYADGVSSDYSVSATYGRNNVWKSGYKAVLHHQNGATDSSGNGDWTDTGSPSYSAVVPSQGVDISASTKWVTRNNDGGITRSAPMTMSSVQKFKAVATNAQSCMCWGDYTQSFYWEMRYENSGGWKLCSIKQTGAEIRNDVSYTAQSTNPTHLAMRFDGTNLVHYADMTQIGTQAPSAGSSSNAFMDNMTVGAIPHGTGYMQNFWGNNIVTETRFFLGDLGADWLTAEKNNLLSASTFYTASSGSTNVSVSATVVTATFSSPARTVSGASNVTASVVTATFSSPARTVTGTANVTASVVSATFSIPIVNIITPDAQVNVGVLSAVFSIPAMTVRISTTVSQGTPPSAVFSIPAPSVQIGFTHNASALSAVFSIPAPTITSISNITVSPSVLTATFSIPTPTVTSEQNAMIEAGVLTATFSTPAVSVTTTRNISIDAPVLSATFTILRPRKVGGLWTAQPRHEGVWTPQGREA